MEENKHKKSRALIITIIILLLLILAGYLIYKNRDAFGVKTSATIAKIFSPLAPSTNNKNLTKIQVQAGEDLKKGDSVSVFGTGSNNNPIVMKSTNSSNIYGYTNQDISNGNTGDVTLSNTTPNGFWNSFSGFLGNIFGGNNNNNTVNPNNSGDSCTNGTDNFPLCTTINGQCQNSTDNPPLCTTNGNTCFNGAINPPECNNNGSTCTNNTDNYPLCTTLNGVCPGGEINPPMCNNDGTQCTNNTDNYPLCTTKDGKCPGGQIDPPFCIDNGTCLSPKIIDANTKLCIDPSECISPRVIVGNKCEDANSTLPDLTVVGNVTPISTEVNAQTTFSANIMNTGMGSTEHSFSVTFFMNTLGQSETKMVSIVPTLAGGVSATATASIKFSLLQDFSIRVCADKNSSSDKGTVTESNEDNNCGPYTIIKVGNSLPQPCPAPKLTDTISGKCIDPSQCLPPKVINGNNCDACTSPNLIDTASGQCIDPSQCLPPNVINGNKCESCASPKIIDSDTNQCINPSQCLPPKVINGNKCETRPNVCLFIDQHPIEFTAQEKADLAALLRKYYLIAPTLKTSDDILLTYSEIAQYSNFADQLDTLTGQCYSQTSDPSYAGPKTRYGNPWYQYNTNRGSYVDTSASNNSTNINLDCKYISGWFSGRGASGADCEKYNYNPVAGLYNSVTPASCTTPLDTTNLSGIQAPIYQAGINDKCVWNPGVNISEMEKILNVW